MVQPSYEPQQNASAGGGGRSAGGDELISQGVRMSQQRPDLCAKLSEAQMRVLHLLLAGMTEPQVADRIGRSRHTVHDHTKAIYELLNVCSRVQLVLLFSQRTG